MRAETKRRLWEGLSLLEDFLSGGVHRPRSEPEFSDGPLAAASPPEGGAGPARGRGSRPAPGPRSPAPHAIPALDPGSPIEALPGDGIAAIEREVIACRKCRLCEKRSRPVPGTGSLEPLVLVVGEGPGAEEDKQGLPFVGPAGQLLDKMLEAIGLSRGTNAFIANVVKCRPPMNRDPAPDEQAACAPYLSRQIAVLRPRCILAAGRISAQALLGLREPVTRLRGRFHDFRGIPLLATYHPSALLRDEALKRPAWEDLKLLREKIRADG
jgi:uracil-DNA glycosylase